MNYCIDAEELRAALREIEAAEANGFMHCLAVLKPASAGVQLPDYKLAYSDLLERAHPTDPRLNWGRFQGVTRRYRFKGGNLVSLEEQEEENVNSQWRFYVSPNPVNEDLDEQGFEALEYEKVPGFDPVLTVPLTNEEFPITFYVSQIEHNRSRGLHALRAAAHYLATDSYAFKVVHGWGVSYYRALIVGPRIEKVYCDSLLKITFSAIVLQPIVHGKRENVMVEKSGTGGTESIHALEKKALSADDIGLAQDYADNAFTEQLASWIDDEQELRRLNAHRNENRTQRNLNAILRRAILMREESSCRISGREQKARAEIVRDIIRAKKQLGLHGRQRERSFFKDLWPHIFKHLQETGFKLP